MANPMLIDDADSSAGFNQALGKNKEPRWDEKIKWFNLPDDGEPYRYRLVGKPTLFFNHWVTTRKRDGQWGKPMAVLCKNYDSHEGKSKENNCLVCDYYRSIQRAYGDLKMAYENWDKNAQKMSAKPTMAINAIIRDIQEQGAPTGAKDWTYIAPLKFPKGVSETIVDLAKKYNKKQGGSPEEFYGFNHNKFGKDLNISFNSQADASKMYSVIPGDRTPLTEEEQTQGHNLVDFASQIKFLADQNVEELLQRSGYYDLLQSLQAQAALTKAQAKVGMQQTAPVAQEIPRAVPKPATAAVFHTEDDGGIPAGTEESVPSTLNQSNNSTQATAPASSPIATPAIAKGTPLSEFAALHGKSMKVVDKDYSSFGLKTVQQGTSVPDCFSSYTEQRAANPSVCKNCPIKIDCMQVE